VPLPVPPYAAWLAAVLDKDESAPPPYEMPALVSPWSEYVGIVVVEVERVAAAAMRSVGCVADWLCDVD